MPAPTTIDEFLDLIRKSGVIDEKRLAAELERLREGEGTPTEPGKFAGVLVRDGILTHFQAEQFLQGKWRRFTIGKYKVLERLGAGGMGSVYLCEHTLMKRRVAVKVLPASKSDDCSSRDRFYREARAVAALDHPNIVRAYDIDQDENLHFLVMEHVDGSSLQEIVKKAGPMDFMRAAHYIRQAALGLQHAHDSAGLVHRDVKPGNILVDRNGIVKVLDMGLARFFYDEEDPLTKQYDEQVLGTADYLSPEQALDSHSVDIRADVYSLGCTFYYCLTGRTPFTEGSVARKLIWHQTRQPKPVTSFRGDVPEGILAVLDRMMAKDPAARYQTPQELADALAPWTQTPIPPPPDHEMPTFSLAATASLKPGDATMLAARAAENNAAARTWQVNSPGASATPAPATAPRPSLPATPRSSPNPAAPSSPPTTPGTASAPTAPVSPRPAPPRSPTPEVAAPGSRPPATPPRPARPDSTPPTAPASPRVQSLPTPTPPPYAPPEPLPPPHTDEDPPAPIEEGEFEPAFPVNRSGRSTTRRPVREDGTRGRPLTVLLGVAAAVVFVAAGVLIFFLTGSGGPPDPKAGPRPPIRVAGGVPGALYQALRQAKDGDRLLLEGDVTEVNLSIKVPNLTIEAAPDRRVTWTCPARVDPGSKFFIVESVPGFRLRGVSLDGGNRVESLLVLYGKCAGAHIDKVQGKNTATFGVRIVNCEGTAEAPVRFTDVSITTARPTDSAVRFDLQKHSLALVKVNRHLSLAGIAFAGPGRKVTAADPASVDAGTVELPPGVAVEKSP